MQQKKEVKKGSCSQRVNEQRRMRSADGADEETMDAAE